MRFFRHGPVKAYLAPGDYFLCDPCHLESLDRQWDDFLGPLVWSQRLLQAPARPSDAVDCVVAELDGELFPIYVWRTAYGDGRYLAKKDGQTVGACGIDAGILCLAPARVCPGSAQLRVTLSEVSELVVRDGDMRCGPYSVSTSGDDTDEEEEMTEEELDELREKLVAAIIQRVPADSEKVDARGG